MHVDLNWRSRMWNISLSSYTSQKSLLCSYFWLTVIQNVKQFAATKVMLNLLRFLQYNQRQQRISYNIYVSYWKPLLYFFAVIILSSCHHQLSPVFLPIWCKYYWVSMTDTKRKRRRWWWSMRLVSRENTKCFCYLEELKLRMRCLRV